MRVQVPQARMTFIDDTGSLTPVSHQMLLSMVAAINELQADKAALEARIAALEP